MDAGQIESGAQTGAEDECGVDFGLGNGIVMGGIVARILRSEGEGNSMGREYKLYLLCVRILCGSWIKGYS